MSQRWRRWLWIALAVVLGVLLTLAVGVRLAARQLQSQLLAALGPRATVGAVEIGWTGVELRDLRVAAMAAPRWPSREELRAARVQVRPDLRSLWAGATGGPWRIAQVTVEDGYLSMLRARDGRLRMLPAVFDTPAPDRASGRTAATSTQSAGVVIGQVRLHGVAIDFHDASVRTAVSYRIRIEQIDATIGPLRLPNLDADIDLGLHGTLMGARHNGGIAIGGRLNPATHDARLRADFRGVDLVALQPYLLKEGDGSVRSGRLDLRLDAAVTRMRLHAPGAMTLTGLELASGGGHFNTFAGVPRRAVIAALSRSGRIDVKFALEGRLDDPSFSLNENLATRIASGLAESLGVSLKGVAEGVGGVVRGLLGR